MPGIFINYRRDDAAGFARSLYEHLDQEFKRGVRTQPGSIRGRAVAPATVDAAPKPRTSGETTHERGEDGADGGHRLAHLQRQQACPGDFVNERGRAG